MRGEGNPSIVFVHGWACNRGYWDEQVQHFTDRHQVVTIDLAGHGDSGADRADWSIAAFAEDVLAVVRALELPEVVLVGHSMGGPVALGGRPSAAGSNARRRGRGYVSRQLGERDGREP